MILQKIKHREVYLSDQNKFYEILYNIKYIKLNFIKKGNTIQLHAIAIPNLYIKYLRHNKLHRLHNTEHTKLPIAAKFILQCDIQVYDLRQSLLIRRQSLLIRLEKWNQTAT